MPSILDKYYDRLLDIEFPIQVIVDGALPFAELLDESAQVNLAGRDPWETIELVPGEIAVNGNEAGELANSNAESAQDIRILIATWRKRFAETISLRKMNFPVLLKKYDATAINDIRDSACDKVAEIFIDELSGQDPGDLNALASEARVAAERGAIDDKSEHLLGDYVDEYLYHKLGFGDNPNFPD